MAALGNLPVPNIIEVAVDGTGNSGVFDGETGLDITVAGAIAPNATIAVYFAGAETQNMILALQMMIHPTGSGSVPSVISISYGWGQDDPGTPGSFSDSEWAQFTQLFEDAAVNKITVLVSSGDSGPQVGSETQAQVSYPGQRGIGPSCGGTTIGNINGSSFSEWVWNDMDPADDKGATGGGVSARFSVPSYQSGVQVLVRNDTGRPGRGVPDIAGMPAKTAVTCRSSTGLSRCRLAGRARSRRSTHQCQQRLSRRVFEYIVLHSTDDGLSGDRRRSWPANNNFGDVVGYPAGPGWDACTGLGSVNGQAPQAALASPHAASPAVA
jgi:kumamolisin